MVGGHGEWAVSLSVSVCRVLASISFIPSCVGNIFRVVSYTLISFLLHASSLPVVILSSCSVNIYTFSSHSFRFAF